VVIYRLPLEQSIVKPGSHCTACNKPIRWFNNIPLISYLLLRGKCAECGTSYHWRYPLVEFLTAVLFFFSFRGHVDIAQFRIWFFIAIGMAIIFIDLDHRIIPDELSLGGWAIGFLTAYWDFRNGFGHLVLASIGGFGFFFIFALIYEKITGRVGLGGGDIKFMGTIGIFLGLGGIWATLMISSVLGVIVGLIVGRIQKSDELLKTAIPYGPFLVGGAFIELFFEVSKWMNI
jgi:leader peptidase (prepilin peptidase)/N-methyltransferase